MRLMLMIAKTPIFTQSTPNGITFHQAVFTAFFVVP